MKFEQWLQKAVSKARKRLSSPGGSSAEPRRKLETQQALLLKVIESANDVIWLLSERFPDVAPHSSGLDLSSDDIEALKENIRSSASYDALKAEMLCRFGAYPADGEWLAAISYDNRRYRSLSKRTYPPEIKVRVLMHPFAQISGTVPREARGLVLADFEIIDMLTSTPSFSGHHPETPR